MSIWGNIWEGEPVLGEVENAANSYHYATEWGMTRADGTDGDPDADHHSFCDVIERAGRKQTADLRNALHELHAYKTRRAMVSKEAYNLLVDERDVLRTRVVALEKALAFCGAEVEAAATNNPRLAKLRDDVRSALTG